MKDKSPLSEVMGPVGALSGMGLTIVIPIVIGAFAGKFLDGKLNTGPLFILLGLLLGLIAGVYGAYRLYKSVFH
jgi:ATP synthase protein I